MHVRLEQNAVSIGTLIIAGERHSLPLFREGFYDRAARHPHGWFFPPEEVVRRRLTTVTSLLSEVPGVTIDRRNGESFAAGRSVATGPCPFDVWLDGTRVGRGVNDLEVLAPGAIVRALEVYPSASTVPARFVRGNSLCGALVIGRKGYVQEMSDPRRGSRTNPGAAIIFRALRAVALRSPSPLAPAGDQRGRFAELTAGLRRGDRHQTLLGVTGSGKTMTMEKSSPTRGLPTLVLSHTRRSRRSVRRAQELIPSNAVEYFISYYALPARGLRPSSDTYIEKDASINEE